MVRHLKFAQLLRSDALTFDTYEGQIVRPRKADSQTGTDGRPPGKGPPTCPPATQRKQWIHSFVYSFKWQLHFVNTFVYIQLLALQQKKTRRNKTCPENGLRLEWCGVCWAVGLFGCVRQPTSYISLNTQSRPSTTGCTKKKKKKSGAGPTIHNQGVDINDAQCPSGSAKNMPSKVVGKLCRISW